MAGDRPASTGWRIPIMIFPGQVLIIPIRWLKAAPSEGTAGFSSRQGRDPIPRRARNGSRFRLRRPHPQGSFVRTLEASALEIVFENGDSCFLRPETTLGITTTTREGNTWIRRLFLQVGKIITRIQKATGTQTRFEISTPSAQSAARGTVFRASTDRDDMSRSEVLEGTVSIEAMGASVDVPENMGTAVKMNEAPLPPRDSSSRAGAPESRESVQQAAFRHRIQNARQDCFLPRRADERQGGQGLRSRIVLKPGQAFRVAGLEDGLYYLQSRAFDDLGLEGIPAPPLEIRIRTQPRPPRLQGISSGGQAELRTAFGQMGSRRRSRPVPPSTGQGSRLRSDQRPGGHVSDDLGRRPALAMGDYYLRARSIADDGYEGDWSETYSFSVLPPLRSSRSRKARAGQAGESVSAGATWVRESFTGSKSRRTQDFWTLVHQETRPDDGDAFRRRRPNPASIMSGQGVRRGRLRKRIFEPSKVPLSEDSGRSSSLLACSPRSES